MRREEQHSLTQYTCENQRKGVKPGGSKSIFKEGKMYLFFQLSMAAIIEIKFKALAKMFDN